MLKLLIPDPDLGDQIPTLVAADGRGYVRVLAHDLARSAILLESLGPSVDRSWLAPGAQVDIVCQLLLDVWPLGPPQPRARRLVRDKAAELRDLILRLLGKADPGCPAQVIDQALAYADARSAALVPDQCVWVHGDAAPSNVLAVASPRKGDRTGFVFVDPSPFFGDPAYDLGVLMRDWSRERASDFGSTMHRYCQHAAARTGIDKTAIWQWGYLERVTTGMFLASLGDEPLARRFLDSAARLLR